MKKVLAILLCIVLVITFTACTTNETVLSEDIVLSDEENTDAENTTLGDEETDTTNTALPVKTSKTRKPTTVRTTTAETKYTLPKEGYTRVTAPITTLVEENKIRFIGRTYSYVLDDSRKMVYGNTGFQLEGDLSGDVMVELYVEKASCAINIVVDGKHQVEWVQKGYKTLYLAKNLSKGNHTITVTKGTAHHAGELSIESVTFSGVLKTPKAEKLQIEFIGDSVTVGEGMYGAQQQFNSLAETYNTYDGYAAKVARNLSAGVSTVAYCGAKVPGIKTSFLDETWDFASNKKDIVVINMGTNDLGWSNISLSDVEDTLRADCMALIKAVRQKYGKDTYIVWAYGMMFDKDKAFFKEVTEQYAKNNNDKRVLFCDLSAAKDNAGNASHPSQKGNDKAADILTKFLKEKCDV